MHKTARKTELNVVWHNTGFTSGLSVFFHQFYLSSCACDYVSMVDKNKAFVCCFLATSAIMLSEKKKRKRKMWSKKWYLKRNISCNAFFLGASSPLCWSNNKEFFFLHIRANTTIFHLIVQ